MSLIEKPGYTALPQYYLRAGSDLLVWISFLSFWIKSILSAQPHADIVIHAPVSPGYYPG